MSTGQGGGVWRLQQASKLVGTGAVGSPSKARDRNDNSGTEAAWLFVQPLATVPFLTSARGSRSPLAVLQTMIPA